MGDVDLQDGINTTASPPPSWATRHENTGSISPPPPTTKHKRYKPSHIARREEYAQLTEQVQLLEARLDMLKLKAGVPPPADDTKSVANTVRDSVELDEQIYQNWLRLGRLQAILRHQQLITPIDPLSTYIHLPVDREHRHRILESIEDVKIRRAIDITTSAFAHLDPTKPFVSEHHYDSDDGLHHVDYLEIRQFRRARDVRQLYDAVTFFTQNIEISITDMVGLLALREDDDVMNHSIVQNRIVAAAEYDTIEDLNMIAFLRYFPQYVPHRNSPLGVLAIDNADIDELHPYRPYERLRKDAHTAMIMSQHYDSDVQTPVVVLKTVMHLVQHPPAFPVSPVAIEAIHKNMLRWIQVSNKFFDDQINSAAAHGA